MFVCFSEEQIMAKLVVVFILLQHISLMNSSKVNVININDLTLANTEGKAEENKITVGLLLPRLSPHQDDLANYNRLDSVLPAVVLAAQNLHKYFPGWSWDILVGDTDCNSTTGPLQAVDMFYKQRSTF